MGWEDAELQETLNRSESNVKTLLAQCDNLKRELDDFDHERHSAHSSVTQLTDRLNNLQKEYDNQRLMWKDREMQLNEVVGNERRNVQTLESRLTELQDILRMEKTVLHSRGCSVI